MSGLVPGYLHIVNSIKARTVRTAVTTDKPAQIILEVVEVVVAVVVVVVLWVVVGWCW